MKKSVKSDLLDQLNKELDQFESLIKQLVQCNEELDEITQNLK